MSPLKIELALNPTIRDETRKIIEVCQFYQDAEQTDDSPQIAIPYRKPLDKFIAEYPIATSTQNRERSC